MTQIFITDPSVASRLVKARNVVSQAMPNTAVMVSLAFGRVTISVVPDSSVGGPRGLTYELLRELSDVLGTTKITVEDMTPQSGCPTRGDYSIEFSIVAYETGFKGKY